MALLRALLVFLSAAALLPHTSEAIDPVRWLDHRGRGHRALLQDPTFGEQPQPDAGVSDIGAGVDAGATAVEDPSTQPAVADAVATPGFDPGMLASDVPADTGIPTDVPADSGDPAAQGDPGAHPDPGVAGQQDTGIPGEAIGQTDPSVPGDAAGQTDPATPGEPVRQADFGVPGDTAGQTNPSVPGDPAGQTDPAAVDPAAVGEQQPGVPGDAAAAGQVDPAVTDQQGTIDAGVDPGQTDPTAVAEQPNLPANPAAVAEQPGVPAETAPTDEPGVAATTDEVTNAGQSDVGIDPTDQPTSPGDAEGGAEAVPGEAGTDTTSPGLNHGALAEELIAERQHQAMGDDVAPPPPAEAPAYAVKEGPCGDRPPPGDYTCADQKGFGKCDADFMLAGNYCDRTCGRCTGPCIDYAPPGPYGCAEQWQFGKCDEAFLRDYGYCDVTCARCAAAPAPAGMGEGTMEDSTDVTIPDTGATADPTAGAMPPAEGATPAEGGMDQPSDMPTPVFDEGTPAADGVPTAAADDITPETPVDTLTSDTDYAPTAAEEPMDTTTGMDMAAGPAAEGSGDRHTDGELTAYQALLSGAYLADLVSMEPKEHSTYAWVHGILMASAWGLIIPCGVLISRYGKPWSHWFVTHRTVQTIGYMVVLAGFVMAYLMHHSSAAHEVVNAAADAAAPLAGKVGLSDDPLVGRRRRLLHEVHDDPARSRVAELHGLVGFVVLGLVTLQVLAHFLRPGKEATGRVAWGWYHWAVGWAVLGLASINVFQGLALIDAGRWYVLGYALAVATFIGGVMFVEIRRCIYGHELEGYKHANEHGDLEMVGGSHEEREGILGSYGNGLLHDVGDDSDEDLTMLRRADQAKFAQD